MLEQALTVLFVFMISLNISWILLFFLPQKPPKEPYNYTALSIILPAHNEEEAIASSIRRCLLANYPAEKEVLVVNDGSTDRTREVVERMVASDGRVRLIDLIHSGKAKAINAALKEARGDIVVVIDADSEIEEEALMTLTAPFSDSSVAAVSGVIRARMNGNPLVWYQDLEYMMSSTWRYVCGKINATYLLPGFTAFRKDALLSVGGFNSDTLAEDFEIGIRLKKAGFRMVMSNAVMYTHVPQNLKALVRQRLRWSRGTLQVVRKHSDVPLNPQYGAVGVYGVPTQLYWFVHGSIALPLTAYQILYGYMAYFVHYSDFFSLGVVRYFFGWFSVYGMLEYSYKTFTGEFPMTHLFILCFVSFTLGTAYTFLSIIRHSRITMKQVFAVFFYYPYSLFCLLLLTIPLFSEMNLLSKKKRAVNIWHK